MDWNDLPIQRVPLADCVYPCHDLDPDHLHPTDETIVTTGPVHLQRLLDGSLFVHDGRHRIIRATLAGETMIEARVYPT